MKPDIKTRIKKYCAWLYLIIVYSYIIYDYSYLIRVVAKPIGLFVLLINNLSIYCVYLLINHIFIKKIIPTKILLTIEILLFIALYTLFISDIAYENHDGIPILTYFWNLIW